MRSISSITADEVCERGGASGSSVSLGPDSLASTSRNRFARTPEIPRGIDMRRATVGADSRHEVQIMLLQFRALRFGYRPHLGESGVCLGDCITRRTDIRVGAVGV